MDTYKAWLADVLDKNKRMFQIPVYQRNYDWSNVQCEKLFEDIISAYQNDKKHFIGTIVYVNNKDSSGLKVDLIIDGQQRITTIFILIKALLEKAIQLNESAKSELEELLYNRNCEEKFKLKLKPIKDDNEQFKLLMSSHFDQMKDSSNILKNYNLFLKLINQLLEKGVLIKEILYGIKQLQIIEIVLDKNDDDPQIIFESINSTGLELSLADKIRNFILMNDEAQEELFENYWNYIEQLIGADNMEDYLVNFLNYKVSDNINSKKAYDKFKKLFNEKGYTNKEMLGELKKCGVYYATFIGKHFQYGKDVIEILSDFRSMDQSTTYPFLFSIFNDYDNNIIDKTELVKILNLLRTYCFRRIICEIPSNSLRGLFKTLYNRLFDKNKTNYYQKIYSFFMTIKSRDKMLDKKEVSQKLKIIDLYNKKKVCKFLLSAIENSGSNEKIDMSNLTIEHILPQQKYNVTWKKIIGENYEYVYDTYLHTIGNLTITGYNSELGTKSFEEKVNIIKEHSKTLVLNLDIIDKTTWTATYIEDRAQRLIKMTNELFNLESSEIIDIDKKEEERYTLDDVDEATGTKPTTFTFVGEIISVESFAEMLSKIMNILYSSDPKYLLELAKSKFKMVDDGRVYVSYNLNDLARGKEIDNTGVFVEYNLSTKDILTFIKKMLQIHSYESEDFYFTAKKRKEC